jgi:hypothetical protein
MPDKQTNVLLPTWTFITSPIPIAIISFIAGAILSLFTPWNKWFIENKKTKQAYRKEKIIQWRKMVHEISNAQDGSNKPVSHLLERHESYYSLRPHLSTETIGQIARVRTIIADSTISAPLQFILDDIDRIEKEWHLV